MIGAVIAAVLAITGAAADLIGLFTIIGASFGPICGAMMADYLLSGRKWEGPRGRSQYCGLWRLGGWVYCGYLAVSAHSGGCKALSATGRGL